MRNYTWLFLVFLTGMLASCGDGKVFPPEGGPASQGWVPIQVDQNDLFVIRAGESNAARLFSFDPFYDPSDSSNFKVIGEYRYVLDSLEGITVQEATNDVYSSFNLEYLIIPGITNLRIENGQLVANNMTDELVLSVTNAPVLEVVERRTGVAPPFIYPDEKPDRIEPEFNPDSYSYFQCYDASAGVLLGWKLSYGGGFDCFLLPE